MPPDRAVVARTNRVRQAAKCRGSVTRGTRRERKVREVLSVKTTATTANAASGKRACTSFRRAHAYVPAPHFQLLSGPEARVNSSFP